MNNAGNYETLLEATDPDRFPVGQILGAREVFGLAITFEILCEVADAVASFELCSKIVRLGYHVEHTAYWAERSLFLKIRDNSQLDPQLLADAFAEANGLTMLRWTIAIQGHDRAA